MNAMNAGPDEIACSGPEETEGEMFYTVEWWSSLMDPDEYPEDLDVRFMTLSAAKEVANLILLDAEETEMVQVSHWMVTGPGTASSTVSEQKGLDGDWERKERVRD